MYTTLEEEEEKRKTKERKEIKQLRKS